MNDFRSTPRLRGLMRYAVGADLVLIALGVSYLLPSEFVLVPFVIAVAIGASVVRWRSGLATTVASVIALLLFVDPSPSPAHVAIFAAAGIAASLLLGTRRRVDPNAQTAEQEPRPAVLVAQLTEPLRARTAPLLRNLGLPALVALVYLNLSTILVEQFAMPSILQPVILMIAGLVVLCWSDLRPAAALTVPAAILVGVYGLILFTSSNWARDLYASNADLADFAKSLILLAVVASLASTWRALRGALAAVVASAVFISVLVLIQVAVGDPELQFWGFAKLDQGHIFGDVLELRPAGPIGDANYLARILILAVPAAAFLGMSRPIALRLAFAGAAAVIALAILFTYSRGGMLTLAAVGFFLVLAGRPRLTPRTLVIAGVLILAILPTNVGKRLLTIESMFSSDDLSVVDASADKRRHLLEVGLAMLEAHPLLGVGVANFGNRYAQYASVVGSSSLDYSPAGVRQFPHNLYLEIATETGLLGLAAFVAVMSATLLSLHRSRRTLLARGETAHAGLVTAIEIAIAGYLIASLLLHSGWPRYLWLFVGLALAAIRLARTAPEPDATPALDHQVRAA